MSQTMTPPQSSTRLQLVERAAAIAPTLRTHAQWGEDNRRLHEETVEAMAQAGLFKMRAPVRFGGYESPVGTVNEVLAQLGRADGSASWVASIWSISTWIAGLLPDEGQDEVFSVPGARVAGILSPGGIAAPDRAGGVLLNGRWSWNSAILHSHWDVLAAVSPTPDGGHQPVMVVVPADDLMIVDDWHTSGLRGTGSVTSVAEDVYVPAHRVMPLGPMLQERYASTRNADSPIFRTPLIPTGSATTTGTVLGMARGAMEHFLERLPGRGISYTSYSDRSQHPLTHMQIAEATMKLDEAEFHANRAAESLDGPAARGESWTMEERAKVRLDASWVCRLAKEAVDVLNEASGASSTYLSVPMQRHVRDLQMINLHALMQPHTNLELYGRTVLGLEPNTPYV